MTSIIKRNHLLELFIILLTVFILFGFWNIGRLGLITDDWDTFRSVMLFKGQSFKEIWNYFMWQSGISILQRPYWVLFMLPQLAIFKTNILLYFILNIVIFSASVWLGYKILLRLSIAREISLMAVIIFILIPHHYTSLFWISAQMSLLGFFFGMLAWYLIIKQLNRVTFQYILGVITLVFSIIIYELNISYIIPIVLSTIFIVYCSSNKNKIKKLFIYLIPVVLSPIGYILYRRILIYFIPDLDFVRSADTSLQISTMIFQLRTALSSLAGPKFWWYTFDTFQSLEDIQILNGVTYMILILILAICLIVYSILYLRKIDLVEYQKPKAQINPFILAIFFLSAVASIFPIFLTNYNLNVGGIDDRLNLVCSFYLSVFLVFIIQIILKKHTIFVFTGLVVYFTVISWVVLGRFIKVNDIQLDFIEHLEEYNIEENTLINFKTNIQEYKNVPIFNTIWGNSYLISNAKGRLRVETNVKWNKLIDGKYKSILDKRYIYENPNIINLHYNYPSK